MDNYVTLTQTWSTTNCGYLYNKCSLLKIEVCTKILMTNHNA